MGTSVELNKCNYSELLNALVTKFNIEDIATLEKALGEFGEKAGDQYFILNNEYYEEFNAYYSLGGFIDRYFGVEDSFSVICGLTKEANCNVNEDDVAEILGVELPEREYEE